MLRLHNTLNHTSRRSSRAGFSLVELLVSITIFIILATLALSAFRDSKHDKVASASRQISASIGGARSRASKAIEPRGIRLLRDKQDYRWISGLQYVGQSQLYNGDIRVQIDSLGDVQLVCQQAGVWDDLRNEGLLTPGCQVYIRNYNPNFIPTLANPTPKPEDATSGRWYTISSTLFNPGAGIVHLVGMIDSVTWDPGLEAWQAHPKDTPVGGRTNTYAIPYLLRISPHELPDAEPINLPPGIVIDLPSSKIPTSWKRFEDANQNGTLDANEDDGSPTDPIIPYLPNPYDNGNGILDDVSFDIPVSPNGTVGGAISGSGPIYLYVCPREDVDRMRAMLDTTNGGVYGSDYLAGLIPGDFENGYGPDHPSSERKLVCIIPQTGLVYMAEVNGFDGDSAGAPGYGWADDPYSFARAGREGR